jgi:hypothetical protein
MSTIAGLKLSELVEAGAVAGSLATDRSDLRRVEPSSSLEIPGKLDGINCSRRSVVVAWREACTKVGGIASVAVGRVAVERAAVGKVVENGET